MVSFDINNQNKVQLIQDKHDDNVTVQVVDKKNNIDDFYTLNISNGDMVMLLNYYRWVKENDIQCNFINTSGKKKK